MCIRDSTKVVHEFYDSNFEYLTEASEDTVVLLISFARYTKWSDVYKRQSYFNPGFAGQPIAHTDGLWNALGMYLAGFGCILLGGCPLRQLILAGEGNTDSAVTVLGLMAGAAFAHNFGLASSGEGPTAVSYTHLSVQHPADGF